MNRYKENKCRLCQKVFCCKKCREQHETLIHKIFVDCNICLYGKTFLQKDASESLIRHIKKQHWPLHCVICKKNVESMEEILRENVCRREHKNSNFKLSPYTPIQHQDENKCYLEPKMFCNLATSTPLQGEEISSPEKIYIQVATPVDMNKEKIYYPDSVSIKRKVTFFDTPITETSEDKENVEGQDNIIEDKIMVTPISGNNNTVFYSAKQYLQENSTNQAKENEVIPSTENKDNIKLIEEKAEVGHEDSILWMSAVNTSDSMEKNKPAIDTNIPTPVKTKFKKKKVNVVLPTAIRKQSVELELPSDIRLTSENITKFEESASNAQGNSFETRQLQNKIINVNNVDYSSIADANETSTSASSRLWTSMSKIIRSVANAIHELSDTTCDFKTPLKRSFLDDSLGNAPRAKRYKLTEIKCRPPIRLLAGQQHEESRENYKIDSSRIILGEFQKKFVDKATQTDEFP